MGSVSYKISISYCSLREREQDREGERDFYVKELANLRLLAGWTVKEE